MLSRAKNVLAIFVFIVEVGINPSKCVLQRRTQTSGSKSCSLLLLQGTSACDFYHWDRHSHRKVLSRLWWNLPVHSILLTASHLENSKRPPGRPQTMWMKTIQQDLKSNNLSLNACWLACCCPSMNDKDAVLARKRTVRTKMMTPEPEFWRADSATDMTTRTGCWSTCDRVATSATRFCLLVVVGVESRQTLLTHMIHSSRLLCQTPSPNEATDVAQNNKQ